MSYRTCYTWTDSIGAAALIIIFCSQCKTVTSHERPNFLVQSRSKRLFPKKTINLSLNYLKVIFTIMLVEEDEYSFIKTEKTSRGCKRLQ